MDDALNEGDELSLSNGEILKTINKQNELTEKFFEEEVFSDAAKKGFRLLERTEVYNNRFALYSIAALFADCEENYCVTLSDLSKICFYYRGNEELCRALFERIKENKDSFISASDQYLSEDHPLLKGIAKRFGIKTPPSIQD